LAVDIVVWFCLIIVLLITAYPFWYVVVASFSDGYDFMRGGVYLWPRIFTLDNYKNLLGQKIWTNAFVVSFIRTIAGTFLTVCMTCLVSYTLSRKDLMFGKIYRFLVVFAMYVSGGLIPYYIVLKNLHLVNTFWVFVIPSMLNLFFIIVGMNFFGSIPMALLESAKLDGASELKTLIRIVMPISTPFIATLSLFSAVNQWNSWLDSSYYVNKESLRTVPNAGRNQPVYRSIHYRRYYHYKVDYFDDTGNCHGYQHAAYHVCLSVPAEIFCTRIDARSSQGVKIFGKFSGYQTPGSLLIKTTNI